MASEGNFQLWLQNKQSSPFESDSIKHVRESRAQTQLMREYNVSVGTLISQGQEQSFALDSMTYGIEGVRDAVERMSVDLTAGFKALGALFDWRMQTVIALLEEQQRTQNEMLKCLKYPRTTEAEEMKERARKSYFKALETATTQPDWHERYLADALRDFSIAADKNPQDYTLHLDIGRILLLEHNQPAQALRYLDDAARHAHMESDEWEGKAFFLMARARELKGELEEAYAVARRAVELDANNLVYIYELARYCALTDRAAECARHLERMLRAQEIGGVVSADEAKVWWAKIGAEKDFMRAGDEIARLFERLMSEARQLAQTESDKALKAFATVERAMEMAGTSLDVEECKSEVEKLQGELSSLRDKEKTNGYFESFFLTCKVIVLHTKAIKIAHSVLERSLTHWGQLEQQKRAALDATVQEVLKVQRQTLSEMLQPNNSGDALSTVRTTFVTGAVFVICVPFGVMSLGEGLMSSTWLLVSAFLFFVVPGFSYWLCKFVARRKKDADVNRLQHQLNDCELQKNQSAAPFRAEIEQLRAHAKCLAEALHKVQRGEYL